MFTLSFSGYPDWTKDDYNINSWSSKHDKETGLVQASINIGYKVSFAYNDFSNGMVEISNL